MFFDAAKALAASPSSSRMSTAAHLPSVPHPKTYPAQPVSK